MSKALNPDKSLLKPHSRASNPVSGWSPPPSGSIKINCNASWNAGSHSGFAGIVVCNHTGMLLDGRRVSISGPSALSCEALALRKSCLMGKALHLSGIQVENDNKHLITLCVSELVPPWECRRSRSKAFLFAFSFGDISVVSKCEGDSRSVQDAFFLGKALAEAVNERVESAEDVLERAKRAKEKAAREAMEAQSLAPKPSTAEVSVVSDVDTTTNSSSVTVAVTSAILPPSSSSSTPDVETKEDTNPTENDPLEGVSDDD
ncbi:hypothetical protein C3L33_23351, partial [Rhododendron williamsianum]